MNKNSPVVGVPSAVSATAGGGEFEECFQSRLPQVASAGSGCGAAVGGCAGYVPAAAVETWPVLPQPLPAGARPLPQLRPLHTPLQHLYLQPGPARGPEAAGSGAEGAAVDAAAGLPGVAACSDGSWLYIKQDSLLVKEQYNLNYSISTWRPFG